MSRVFNSGCTNWEECKNVKIFLSWSQDCSVVRSAVYILSYYLWLFFFKLSKLFMFTYPSISRTSSILFSSSSTLPPPISSSPNPDAITLYHLLLVDSELSAHSTRSNLHVNHWLPHVQCFLSTMYHSSVYDYMYEYSKSYLAQMFSQNLWNETARWFISLGHHLTIVTAWFNQPACGDACVARLTAHANAPLQKKKKKDFCLFICTNPT